MVAQKVQHVSSQFWFQFWKNVIKVHLYFMGLTINAGQSLFGPLGSHQVSTKPQNLKMNVCCITEKHFIPESFFLSSLCTFICAFHFEIPRFPLQSNISVR